MTEKELAEIEARANAATSGPWKWHKDNVSGTVAVVRERDFADGTPGNVIVMHEPRTCEFIAHSREDVPRLLAALREAMLVARQRVEMLLQLKEDWEAAGDDDLEMEEIGKQLFAYVETWRQVKELREDGWTAPKPPSCPSCGEPTERFAGSYFCSRYCGWPGSPYWTFDWVKAAEQAK